MTHRPRKRFGQNFLRDPSVIARILEAAAPGPDDHFVEIGPGQGALTRPLLERVGRLDLIEIDRDLVARLRQELGDHPRLHIHQADALRFDYGALATPHRPLRLIGNLPYNISTPLLFHLLQHRRVIADMLFMLQKEVVDRLAAAPGGKTYGRLSVTVQYHCRVEPLFRVPPGAFRPVPKVDSRIVRLRPHPHPPYPEADPEALARLAAAAFSQRRKTLRNALKGLLPATAIKAAGLDPEARPETLSVADYARLAQRLAATEDAKRPRPPGSAASGKGGAPQ